MLFCLSVFLISLTYYFGVSNPHFMICFTFYKFSKFPTISILPHCIPCFPVGPNVFWMFFSVFLMLFHSLFCPMVSSVFPQVFRMFPHVSHVFPLFFLVFPAMPRASSQFWTRRRSGTSSAATTGSWKALRRALGDGLRNCNCVDYIYIICIHMYDMQYVYILTYTGCCERKKNMKPSIVSRLYIPKISFFSSQHPFLFF